MLSYRSWQPPPEVVDPVLGQACGSRRFPVPGRSPHGGARRGTGCGLGCGDRRDDKRDAVALAAILPGPLCELGFTANRDGVTLAEPDQLLGELAKPDYRGE